MIKYGHVWKDETVKALLKLKTVDKTYADRVHFKKFCDAFDAECKLVRETAIAPNLEKLKAMDPETLNEVNEFLNKDCDLKPLPASFHEVMQKAVLSDIDEEHLLPLIASEEIKPTLHAVP